MSTPERSELAVDVRAADKRYRKTFGRPVHALRGVDVRVHRGEVFGLLGPNGAGKSTLVKILMTIIRPTRAEGTVLGHRIGDKRALFRVGYLPEHHRFPPYLKATEVMSFLGQLSGVPLVERRRRIPALLERVGLGRDGHRTVGEFSKGMRQRLGLAQALINDPDLLLLDEPTDGVDPVGRRDMREMMLALKRQGKAVFINSHLLSELEAVCDRVAILVQGRVGSQGSIHELTSGQRRFELRIAPPNSPDGIGTHAPTVTDPALHEPTLQELGSAWASEVGSHADVSNGTLRLWTDDARVAQRVIDAARARGLIIDSFRPVRPSLEDLFMQAVERDHPATASHAGPEGPR